MFRNNQEEDGTRPLVVCLREWETADSQSTLYNLYNIFQ